MQLTEAARDTSAPASLDKILPGLYHAFQDIFSKESFDKLPEWKQWDHAINLIPGAQPFSMKVYPILPVEQKELDQFLEENLASGQIHPSKSLMPSPIFFIDKKDSKLRFMQDYQKLNAMAVKNTYPLPLVLDIINKILEAKGKYFTKLDVYWGYNNICFKGGDEWKAAFCTNCGLFKPLVMYFGLTNSLATFQTMMNNIFKELIDEGFVAIYMDDILVYT